MLYIWNLNETVGKFWLLQNITSEWIGSLKKKKIDQSVNIAHQRVWLRKAWSSYDSPLISKCVHTYMSERVRRDYGRSLYPWNVTAGRYCYLGHTCLCSDDVTATWGTGAGRQRPSVIVYRSVRVVVSRVVTDCYCSYCVLSISKFYKV